MVKIVNFLAYLKGSRFPDKCRSIRIEIPKVGGFVIRVQLTIPHCILFQRLRLSFSIKQVFRLSLTTQAGTYVKEFVHGDFGRTTPNLREILNIPDLDIIALDVMVTI